MPCLFPLTLAENGVIVGLIYGGIGHIAVTVCQRLCAVIQGAVVLQYVEGLVVVLAHR